MNPHEKKTCHDPSLEPPHRGGSNDRLRHVSETKNKDFLYISYCRQNAPLSRAWPPILCYGKNIQ